MTPLLLQDTPAYWKAPQLIYSNTLFIKAFKKKKIFINFECVIKCRNKSEKKCKDSELDCEFTNSTPNYSTLLYQIFQNVTPGNAKAFNSGIK